MVLTQPVWSERVHFELGTTRLGGCSLRELSHSFICDGFGCEPGGSARHVQYLAECLAGPFERAQVRHYSLRAYLKCARHFTSMKGVPHLPAALVGLKRSPHSPRREVR
jgi:hypothetical protein